MDELKQEILAEKEQILATLRALNEVLNRETKDIVELAGIATFLQNVYNGMENIFKRILKFKKISIPDSETSHKDLLDIVVENNIVTMELSLELDQYRAFRHFFVHGYVLKLDDMKLMPLAKNLPEVWEKFDSEISNFLNILR